MKSTISPFLASAIRIALRTLTTALGLWIKDPKKLALVSSALNLPIEVVDILSDENPNDGDQALALVNRTITANTGLVPLLLQATRERIDRLPEGIRPIPRAFLNEGLTIADLLTDDDRANAAQLEGYLRALPRDPDAADLLSAVLGLWLKDERTADEVTLFVLEAIANLLRQRDEQDPQIKATEAQARAVAARVAPDHDVLNPRRK